ncbi:MAG: heme lyase NrfEFG subunit NrfE, partial [Sphingomonadales bacterium]|nr:heme lyase NrfEFG subunit NrfE [Sphingomonadales bacterium]
RVAGKLVISGVLALAGMAFMAWSGAKVLPVMGMALAAGLLVATVLPLVGRKLRTVRLPTWGMVLAHFGVTVALFGMATDSAFTVERLVAVHVGEATEVGPWRVTLRTIVPVAGPNWTALEGDMGASYRGGSAEIMRPQSRSFWAPLQQTNESALLTRWNGQLYAVLGEQAEDGRWQLRLWWKPFVIYIWIGGLFIGLGGVLALIGRVASDVRRLVARDKIAYRRLRQGR